MTDPRWTGPPEVIAATFEAGSPASVIAANAAWVTEMASHEMSMGLSAANTAATAAVWQGSGATASTATAAGLNSGLAALAGWAAQKVAVTQAAAEAYTTASSSVIPSAACQLNRDQWATANATNFFGIRTPEIVALDLEYFGEHWPHNSAVGGTYCTALTALSAALAVPAPVAPMGASPAAPAAAGEAVARAAAQTGMDDAMGVSTQATKAMGHMASAPTGAGALPEAASAAVRPLAGLTQAPMQALQQSASAPATLMQSVGPMFGSAARGIAPAEVMATPAAASGSTGAAPIAQTAGGPGTMSTGYPGAGLTSYARPAGSFEPPAGGRPAGWPPSANAAGPTATPVAGGAPMPMSPAGAQARGSGEPEDEARRRARVVAEPDSTAKP